VKSRDRIDPAHLEQARQVADAILYEGYLLYPYRASAQKNQERFQFGVLMPAAYRAVDEHEPSAAQTECVLDGPADSAVTVLARFLQVQRRTVLAGSPDAGFREVGSLEAGGVEHTPWDEAAECEQEAAATLGELLDGGTETEFTVPGATEHEDLPGPGGTQAGRLVRQRETLHAVIRMSAERLPGPYGAIRLRVVLENRTEPPGPLGRRSDGLPYALIAAHCLIAAPGGRFLSMTDPPQWAAAEVGRCVNTGTWPVLAGPPDCTELMLSSPVILYDHAEIAAESAGPLFDSTEIDEILTLRVMTMTDEEKAQARATDPLAAQIIDRCDSMSPEAMARLHGALRDPREPVGLIPEVPDGVDWWDPLADNAVQPDLDAVLVNGVRVARGSRVLLHPARRADAQDLFFAEKTARVTSVHEDVDGNQHVGVVVEDDPAADLHEWYGRYLYFSPDEVEPLETSTTERNSIWRS
jgi:hypothetical protein